MTTTTETEPRYVEFRGSSGFNLKLYWLLRLKPLLCRLAGGHDWTPWTCSAIGRRRHCRCCERIEIEVDDR